MRKRILSILLTLCMVLSIAPAAVFAEGSTAPADITGTGASDDPYLIYTAAGLKAFRDKVNGQNGLAKQPGAHAKLMNDIVLNDGTFDADGNYTPGESGKAAEAWEPIGWFKTNSDHSKYAGTFDGNGHTIKGLYVAGEREHAGLFGITEGATVKNVTVDGYVSASGSNDSWWPCTGGIVGGANNTHIENCTNLSTVESDFAIDGGNNTATVGGIAGNLQNGSISNCRSGGKVILKMHDSDTLEVGGIVGSQNAQVSSCCNTGAVIVHSNNDAQVYNLSVGGVVGTNGSGSQFKSCYNTGAVTVTGDFTAGGTWVGVGGVGGVVGVSNSPVSSSYNTGKVSYDNDNVNVGGVAGVNYDTTVTNCYFLKDTAANGVGSTVDLTGGTTENTVEKTKAEFANGTVLGLLKQNDTTNAWGDKCGYLEDAGMMVPLLDWQTAGDAFLICTAEDLRLFRDIVNGGNANINAKLMNDIVLNDGTFDENGNWSEDGTPNKWTPINDYTGTFDGQNFTVKGVYVTNEMYAGLFGSVRGGTVKNVAVTGYVEGTEYVGGIVGYGTYATVSGCTNHAAVKAKNEILCVGGIAGCVYEQGIVTGCTNTGAVTAFPIDGSSYWGLGYVGGIVGGASTGSMKNRTAVSITACANLGEVSAFIDSDKAGAYVGGIAGEADGRTIPTDCFNTGDISITERNATCWDTSLGGIVGYAPGVVTDLPYPYTSNCYSVGTLTHTGNGPVGICGIVGDVVFSRFSVDRCYWLEGTAESGVGGSPEQVTNTDAHTKADFANGAVLELLKNGRTDSPWADECQYVAAAGMTLPVFKGQGDSHTHSEKTGNCLDGIYCECGYLMHMATSEHHWGEWVHNLTSHSRTCNNPGCGVTQSGNCSGGTATCTEQAKCDVCHKSYGAKNPDNHTDTTEWVQTETKHTQKYKCCGAVTVAEEDHEWENGVCTECHYACAHTGGTATCTDKAECEVCGESYGKLNENNHADMKHIEAKAATKTAEGNIEYWYCEGCGKYFADKDGAKEITKADTVTAKLPDDSKSPQTGDNSNLALWIALLFVSGGAAIGTTVVSRKKKYNR